VIQALTVAPTASTAEQPQLEVSDIVAGYGKSMVVDGVSLSVHAGEIALLLGRNGVGKTTTLRCIAGVHPVITGTVRLDGVDVTHRRPFLRVRSGLAMVPSGARAFGPLTVEENLRLVTGGTATGSERWDVDRVYELFPKLRTLRQSQAGSLSGGERQMLAVGRALMANPRVMLLDEPSEGLAPVIVQTIGELLLQLRQTGIAVLLAEQNHHMALRVCDRCYFIEKGRVARECGRDEARSDELIRRYLGV
jgi:branched-chain amino acid transport system ATP-binding protein